MEEYNSDFNTGWYADSKEEVLSDVGKKEKYNYKETAVNEQPKPKTGLYDL